MNKVRYTLVSYKKIIAISILAIIILGISVIAGNREFDTCIITKLI